LLTRFALNALARHGQPDAGRRPTLTAIKVPDRERHDTDSTYPARGKTMYQRILVPIDDSATAEKGLDQAIAIARLTRGGIRIVHVVDELCFPLGYETGATYLNRVLPALRQGSERILAAGRQRVAAAAVAVETLSLECFARRTSDVIIEQATDWPADLIVIGTHGRRGMNRLILGSDAEQVLRMAQVPVLLVRCDEGAREAPARIIATGHDRRVGVATA
jgi:nucleotide-binding universal stress UspA family protein